MKERILHNYNNVTHVIFTIIICVMQCNKWDLIAKQLCLMIVQHTSKQYVGSFDNHFNDDTQAIKQNLNPYVYRIDTFYSMISPYIV